MSVRVRDVPIFNYFWSGISGTMSGTTWSRCTSRKRWIRPRIRIPCSAASPVSSLYLPFTQLQGEDWTRRENRRIKKVLVEYRSHFFVAVYVEGTTIRLMYREQTCFTLSRYQCSGSVTFLYGSGSVDSWRLNTDPDPRIRTVGLRIRIRIQLLNIF